MTTLKFILAFLFIALYSCGQTAGKKKPDSLAVQLNNQALNLLAYGDEPDSLIKAVHLLDQATTIDSNFYDGYWNKLTFLNKLKRFDKAILANNKLIQLRPSDYYSYMTGGLLYQYVGDTASAQTYFSKSREISTAILDTMNRANLDYSLVGVSNAITLIMLDDYNIGNQRLKDLVESQPDDPEYGNVTKKYIQSFMNKSKNDLLDFMINPEKYSR